MPTKLSRLLGVEGVNWVGDSRSQFSVVLNILDTENVCPVSSAVWMHLRTSLDQRCADCGCICLQMRIRSYFQSADVLRSPSCGSADADPYAHLFSLSSTIWSDWNILAIISLLSVTVVISFASGGFCLINLLTLSPYLFCVADWTSPMDVTHEQCSAWCNVVLWA